MAFEWDDDKAQGNLAKHGVAFEKATEFEFADAVTFVDDRRDYGEVRLIAIGFIGPRLHVLVYTCAARRSASFRFARPTERMFNVPANKQKKADFIERLRRAELAITPEEDAAITAAALTDPDNPPLTDDDEIVPAGREARAGYRGPGRLAGRLVGKGGRPRLERPKRQIAIRLDDRVIAYFKATGPGWQTRINDSLRRAIAFDQLAGEQWGVSAAQSPRQLVFLALLKRETDDRLHGRLLDLPNVSATGRDTDHVLTALLLGLGRWRDAPPDRWPKPSDHEEILARPDVRRELAEGAFLMGVPLAAAA